MLVFSERLALLRCFEKEAARLGADDTDTTSLMVYLSSLELFDKDKVKAFLSDKDPKELIKHESSTNR